MRTIEVNKDRAVEALAIIEMQPDRHEQGGWRTDYARTNRIEDYLEDPLNPDCQTAFCIGGWVAALDHVKWSMDRHGYPIAHMVGDPRSCTCPPEQHFCTCNEFLGVGQYAQLRLGISIEEADALFMGSNSLETLRIGVKALMNGDDIADAIYEYNVDESDE